MKATLKHYKNNPASYAVITHPDGQTEVFYKINHAYTRLNYLNKWSDNEKA